MNRCRPANTLMVPNVKLSGEGNVLVDTEKY